MAANGSGYVIEFIFLHYPRVIGFQKYFLIFFSSYCLCAVACTKIIDQVLVAANGSGYVIENIILQHLMITRIQKYFLFFFISYGFCVVAKKQKEGKCSWLQMARVTPPFLSIGGTSVSNESKSVFEIFLSFTVFAERLTQNFASGERRKKRIKKTKKTCPKK